MREPAGGGLVAHRPDRAPRGGPTQRDPGGLDRLRERRRSRRGSRTRDGRHRLRRATAAATTAAASRRSSALRPSVAGVDGPDAEASAVRADPGGDLAAVRDEQGPDRREAPAPCAARRAGPRTRLTRQTRHAIARRRVAPAADRPRSSAGRTVSSSRSASRPGSGSALRACCRDCRIRCYGCARQREIAPAGELRP